MAQLTTLLFGIQQVINFGTTRKLGKNAPHRNFHCQHWPHPNDHLPHTTMNHQPGKTLALIGAWLQIGPVFGLLGTVYGMVCAFQDIEASGMGNPEALANNISIAITTTAMGLIMGLIGLIFLAIAFFHSSYRAPWFFKFLIVFAIFWLIHFPIGTIIGVLLLVYIISKKAEFHSQPPEFRT
ncbi:MotA/TolQ/ExbB proton channel family protein [Cerasicoccus arenae]|nr:MotA/TolQ/ExbB proton channel family protein [Cerasicoccus arenae]